MKKEDSRKLRNDLQGKYDRAKKEDWESMMNWILDVAEKKGLKIKQ